MSAAAHRPVLRPGRLVGAALLLALVTAGLWLALPVAGAHAHASAAAVAGDVPEVGPHALALPPGGPQGPDGPDGGDNSVTVDLEGLTDKPGTSVAVLLTLTLLSLLPAIVLTCTSFTKILIVLGLTRNALGLQQTPPNQVLAGLALFLSLFIMAPVLSDINDAGLQPYLDGDKTSTQAWEDGIAPLRGFMLAQTDDEELELLTNVSGRELPETREDVAMSTLVPAFILSELEQAFVIGFIIFIPFLVIDIVVSGALMALGMMMMPPAMVSLPFKLLLFVLVNGWALIITALVGSYG
ncbi:flagellar type III secretion system pore protein FliP [Nocardioides sp. Arc9.136]|uniref:flagellar type III secretion system pore protein FliP n=1 Tax=Nocardioides sp. Arc9.136 TaxID=2996826 RepID=UPI002665456B|nr:flagellar type III secretion system pore protein FliP [Nocardioides sp. Arc9.136]WKN47601.1 flagellar type III secretion system pore protein FliP [Nocardioides sp. Arc9.136]